MPVRCKRCHKVAHLFLYCPFKRKARAWESNKVILTREPQAQGKHPPEDAEIQADPEVAKEKPVKEALKKCRKTPHRPPSPPLTKARAAIWAVLSSGMNTYIPYFVHIFSPSECIAHFTSIINKASVFTTQPPIPLACPLHNPPPTFSNTPPSLPDIPPNIIPASELGPPSPRYLTRSKVKVKAPDYIGIGLDTTPIPQSLPKDVLLPSPKQSCKPEKRLHLGNKTPSTRHLEL